MAAGGLSALLLWLHRRSSRSSRLPPGRWWSLPLLGETLSYVKDPLGFLEERERVCVLFFLFSNVFFLRRREVQASSAGIMCRLSLTLCIDMILEHLVNLIPFAGETHPLWWNLQVPLAIFPYSDLSCERAERQAHLSGKRFGMASSFPEDRWDHESTHGE